MFVTQDIVLRFFFSKKKIINNGFSIPINSSIILAPTHRSRWDGLILTMAMGRRVTKKDCKFMVTKSEMRGIQGWFLKRLGCFSINQLSPSLSALRYAINLIEKEEQLVVFPEGKINRYGKKLVLKEGLYRLALLATKKTKSITILPIGIAYSEVSPKFRSEFCLSFGEPIVMNDYLNTTIEEFRGSERPFFNIFFFLKKNLKTMSWVTNIAINPNTGLILCQISKDFFFKFYLSYINNLGVCHFLLAIIGRLLDCLETKISKL